MSFNDLQKLVQVIDHDGIMVSEPISGEQRKQLLDRLGAAGNMYTVALRPVKSMAQAMDSSPDTVRDEIKQAMTGVFRICVGVWNSTRYGVMVAEGKYVDITAEGAQVTARQAVAILHRHPKIVEIVDREPLPSRDALHRMLVLQHPKDTEERLNERIDKIYEQAARGHAEKSGQ